MDKNTLENAINSECIEVALTDDSVKLGKNIRLIRIYRELSLSDMQNQTGISYQHLSKYEKNNVKMNIANVIKIFDALGYTLTLKATKKNNETK